MRILRVQRTSAESNALQAEVGQSLPIIPKETTRRGGGRVCGGRSGVFAAGIWHDRVRTHGHGSAGNHKRFTGRCSRRMCSTDRATKKCRIWWELTWRVARLRARTITVTPTNPEEAEFGDPVTVTVDIPFSQVSWLPAPMYLGGRSLWATTVMRRERIQ